MGRDRSMCQLKQELERLIEKFLRIFGNFIITLNATRSLPNFLQLRAAHIPRKFETVDICFQ